MKSIQQKHEQPLPSPRGIRRACANELYRTAKRLKKHVPATVMEQAEKLYFKRVVGNLIWIHENRSNRKALADWWDREVSAEIAALWEVEPEPLRQAFRAAFGG